MNNILGISVYLQDMTEEYIANASKNGAKYIFTSLQISEEDLSEASTKIRQLLKYCQKYQMSLVPDVSPITFEKLGVETGDFEALKRLGIDSLRLDYGFDEVQTVKKLQKDFLILLNASTINETFILEAKAAGVDISKLIGVHNFYPKNETGLSLEHVKKVNQVFTMYGIPVVAFVPGNRLKRFPLYEGLPTVERHRGMHPYIAAVELVKNAKCNGVMIGDSLCYDNTILSIAEFLLHNILTIPIILSRNYQYLFEENLASRRDTSELVVRITTPRQSGIKPENNGIRRRGDVIMQNELAGRYGGELQICKRDLGFSAIGNKIGFVHPDFLDILDFVTGEYQLKFVPLDDVYE